MALYFCNEYSNTVYVAILYYDQTCGVANQNFKKSGWYAVNPGQTMVPNIPSLYGDLRQGNARAYFFAEEYSGSQGEVWHGTGNAWASIPNGDAFTQCSEDLANTQQQVDFYDIEFRGFSDVFVMIYEGGVVNVAVPFDNPQGNPATC
jgi:hypothetical protein